MASLPIFVVAGLGNGSGTGATTARAFAKAGFSIALIGRSSTSGSSSIQSLATEITSSYPNVAAQAFTIPSYTPQAIREAFTSIREHKWGQGKAEIRAALWNAGTAVWKGFLDITEEEIKESLDVNVLAAWAFSRETILAFQGNELDAKGKRGTLIFTGATASIRGNVSTSSFAAGKFGLRALSQSLAKEFGKQNIHVAHAIIDGVIITDRTTSRYGGPDPKAWASDTDRRMTPEGIADAYLYLANQERSVWTWELDLRPAHEKW